ncbi:hypothetical protein J3F83DRAFT_718257 [Trichoderma novae-zelandiae]
MAQLRAKWVRQMRSLGVKAEAVNGEEKSTNPREEPPNVESLTLNDAGEGEGDEDEDEDEVEDEGEDSENEDGTEDYEGEDYEGEGYEGDGYDYELENGEEEISEREAIVEEREPAFNWSWWFESQRSMLP